MNIQHSSRTDRWYTPLYIIEMVKEVLGEIDLDPASEEKANEVIGAREFYTRNALNETWVANKVFLNPPGTKIGNQSQSALFWEKLVYHFDRGHIGEAVFMAFSAELLAVSQKYGPKSLLDFTICIPKNRIRFVDPLSPGKLAPSHSNVIVYLGDNIDKFKQVFSGIGACK
jgi:hypothetical protein